jgi:hypothetical protein
MTGSRQRCCSPTEPCPECLAYCAWLSRDLMRCSAGAPPQARTIERPM